MIDDALKARNYLMHHFFVWNSEDYTTEDGRGRMLKELQELRFRIGRTEMAFSQIREQIVEQIYGYNADDMRRLYEKFKSEQENGEQDKMRRQ